MWSEFVSTGLAVLHMAQNLLVPIHQSMTFSVYLCWKSFYTHIAWSNYGLDVFNIAQTYQNDFAYVLRLKSSQVICNL